MMRLFFSRKSTNLSKNNCEEIPFLTLTTGRNQEHDQNVKRFLTGIRVKNLTLNETKIISSVSSLNILGNWVGNRIIKADPERLWLLQNLPVPTTHKSLKRAVGMRAYNTK